MERYFQEQWSRVERLMRLVLADDFPSAVNGALTFYDVAILTCQAMWHLKDWVTNDVAFKPKNKSKLNDEIHASQVLKICADIANGSKHLLLRNPRVGAALSEPKGMHVEPAKGIFKEFCYVVCDDRSYPYDGMEIRDLLKEAHEAWISIINKHYLSEIDIGA
jgi:hypothetical protein